jgi:hypothetical protein
MKKEIFLPPGVQMRFNGQCPRQLSSSQAARLEKLWERRNAAPEAEVDGIDDAMYQLAAFPVTVEMAETSLGGEPAARHRHYVVGPNTGWESVTDIPCPVCACGIIRWAEAGYVPGYRICDGCKRHFLAVIQAGLSKARGDKRSVLLLDSRY